MNNVEKLIKEYLEEASLLQIATSQKNQPWCCTVYFAYDENLNMYWISRPFRRHSVEILTNPHIAGVIVKEHIPGDKVRGIQFEGEARTIEKDKNFRDNFRYYLARYGVSEERIADIISGKDNHELYVVKPSRIVLFDELNFPDDPRQELALH